MSPETPNPSPSPLPEPEDLQRAGIRGLIQDLLGFNRPALVILVMVPVTLTLLDYYGMPWHYPKHRVRRPMLTQWKMRPTQPPLADKLEGLEVPGPAPIRHFIWWGAGCLLFLVLLPMLAAWLLADLSPRALGLRLMGTFRDAWTYLILFVAFFPVIYIVSLSADFQRTYPFFKPPDGKIGTAFIVFEVIYCLQFFAVEFFFRGFMVLGLKPHIGRASVLVMLAPYCMIHYYKPMPEAMGAIAAGLVLGSLAWRTGTILYGWALHYAVALSMDLLALHHRGWL